MNAIIVSVDYTDLLSLTLPYNRHHFNRVMIVTSVQDYGNVQPVAEKHNCDVYETNSFYDHGATFNKWLALEQGLDELGRRGFICVMDADILWPKDLHGWKPEKGYLYSPLRHMHEDLRQRFEHYEEPKPGKLGGSWPTAISVIPPERDWWQFPIHRNISEWAGYTQIFHADDPYLGKPPWYETDWKHAGGADSFFQLKWPLIYKRRPPWECLHLGPAGQNWCGRATPYIDGTIDPQAEVRRSRTRDFIRRRRPGDGKFDHEKIT